MRVEVERSTGARRDCRLAASSGCAASVGDYEGVPVSGRWLVQQRGGKRLRRFNHEPYRTSSARPERGQPRSKLEDERLQGQRGRAHVQHDRRRARQIRKQRGGRKSSQENGGMPAATGDFVEQSGGCPTTRRLPPQLRGRATRAAAPGSVPVSSRRRCRSRTAEERGCRQPESRPPARVDCRTGCQGQQAQEKPDCGWHLSTDRTTAYNESLW